MAYRGLKRIHRGAVLKYGERTKVNAGTLREFLSLITYPQNEAITEVKAGDVFIWNELPCVAAETYTDLDAPIALYTDGVWVLKDVDSYSPAGIGSFSRGELLFCGVWDDDTGQPATTPKFGPDPYYNTILLYGRFYCVGTIVSDGKQTSTSTFSVSVAIGQRSFAQIVSELEETEATPIAVPLIMPTDGDEGDNDDDGGEEDLE